MNKFFKHKLYYNFIFNTDIFLSGEKKISVFELQFTFLEHIIFNEMLTFFFLNSYSNYKN